MNILLTNDDGIYADGIAAIYTALKQAGHDVTVVAPSSERSAVGHAITVSDPLKVSWIDVEPRISGYAVEGTPADCVKIAVNALLDTLPDLVISGINKGANTGNHIIYSGTVSAATEATMFGLPALAVSLDVIFRNQERYDFSYAAAFAVRLCANLTQHPPLPAGTFLNVNIPGIPPRQIKGIRMTKQARFQHTDEYEKRTDPFNRTYYWLRFEKVIVQDAPDVDVDYRLLKEGYIVMTPLHYDLTDYEMLAHLQEWYGEEEKKGGNAFFS
ncbi:5'/3'-nucleotidase SurE [candidate division KSB3 bacterium]|uniref:5'-nucleotidase SurE n=1 Tax=candidate division KSB3 bacterium TaxID=2044937 RepID=A0A9D5JYJ1_9BACT|nr:5'/3'-nucleotidase SurE [candidate division KSB3 bacterium]MBD3326739.1 5'/3'-nucleotidase SurE [candidate division KSB3 bacterium]